MIYSVLFDWLSSQRVCCG